MASSVAAMEPMPLSFASSEEGLRRYGKTACVRENLELAALRAHRGVLVFD